jgi:P27 family predicted phage terminase small subunit
MAKRGRKKRPATAKRAAAEPKARGWTCPRRLTGEAAAAWRHVVALLAKNGDLKRTDPTLVEAYAVNVGLLRAAQDQIRLDGPFVASVNGLKAHPATALINSATMRIKAIVVDLELCPSQSKHAKSKGGGASSEPATASKWDGLLGVVG